MNQRQLASVLFAVVGVFIAVSRLPEVFALIATLARWDPINEDPSLPYSQRLITIMGLIGLLLMLLVGLGLLLLRDRLAQVLFPAATQPVSARDVQAVAFSVLGCYFVVQGFSLLVWARQLSWDGATQVVLGLALFFGARGLSRFWSFLRSAGT